MNTRFRLSAFLVAYSIASWPAVVMPAQAEIAFQDVTNTAGFTYEGESWGGSWGDLNGDHLPDLFSNHHRNKASVYVNRGNGVFDDVASEVDTWDTPAGALIDMHGGSWADFDNDGDLDLYISAGRSNENQFFRNDAGRLVDVTAQLDPGVPNLRGRMPIWFDFTGDGLLDFFIAAESTVPLFARSGAGFVDQTSQAGFACSKAQFGILADLAGGTRLEALCISGTFVINAYDYPAMPFTRVTNSLPKTGIVNDVVAYDFNGDLKTDVFLLKGGNRLSGALQRSPTAAAFQLITQQGGAEKRGRFASSGDVTFAVSTTGWNMTPGDIFIGSGGQRPPNPVVDFRTITFTLQPSNAAHHGIAAHDPAQDQGVYIGYNPVTGIWDVVNSPGGIYTYIYIDASSTAPVSAVTATNLAAEDGPIAPKLYLRAASNFSDATAASGLNQNIRCIGAAGGDFDNDTDVDLFVVCRGSMENIANRLYENQGNGAFVLVAEAGGAAGPTGFGSGEGENAVVADYDVDGRLDLFVTNGLQLAPIGDGGRELLFRNVGATGNHWLELDLEGTTSNRDGIGARVLVTANGKTQLREQDGGYHRWSQDSQVLHFGLGGATEASIRVEWPGGVVDTFDNVAADSLYGITENTGIEVLLPGTVPPDESRLSIDDVAVNENGGPAVVIVRRSSAAESASVDYQTVDGSAVSSGDYTAVTGTLVFVAGEATQPLTVSIANDSASEGDEQFTVALSNPLMATIADSTAVVTIRDDDTAICGSPSYNPAFDRALLVFQNCSTGRWSLRATAGGVSTVFRGSAESSQPLSNRTPFSLEASDQFDVSNPSRIVFSLAVGNNGQDGFDFGVPAGASVCLNIQAPPGFVVEVGPSRTPKAPPFDLVTLGPCT